MTSDFRTSGSHIKASQGPTVSGYVRLTLALAFAGHCFSQGRGTAAPETQTQGLYWACLWLSPHLSVITQRASLAPVLPPCIAAWIHSLPGVWSLGEHVLSEVGGVSVRWSLRGDLSELSVAVVIWRGDLSGVVS